MNVLRYSYATSLGSCSSRWNGRRQPGIEIRSRKSVRKLPLDCRSAASDDRSDEDRVRLRSEAEAPFRSLRFTLFGFGVVSAGVSLLVSLPQLIGAVGGAPNALPLNSVLTNVGVDLAAILVLGYFLRSDLQARDKQIARLTREEKLGNLGVQLSSGKRLPLSALRGSSRVVIVAGSKAQVSAALEAAAPFREELVRRGVFVVAAPIFGDEGADLPDLAESDLRWRGVPIRSEEWFEWFQSQLKLTSKASSSNGLFVGLRLDGRVRASGQGIPPWPRFAAELAPLAGNDKWTGFFDGFDGRIGLD
ncbi:hypothetical protein CEUSTIGMA_g2726.t1 [Chlamydomonas eustigma]|uniref:Uncharacterized protein n=1 Tax=Chlamydomonas eustigma TaxID=1157962 RepID=A0A250WWT7_9CHLO|nr:hypothetical protein CEUSTIGMA_g2726.t1 [Chlamydomonas eustigma]|eukprot:GAX75281.1 hypothetical protein CEUSTIGMA_g2726.t1 [Chlamydomonas eustigma]